VSEAVVSLRVPPKFRPLLKNQKRWEVAYGGAGSGKSYNVTQKIVLRCVTEEKHRYLVVRKVARTLRASVFQLFLDVLSKSGYPDSLLKVNRSDMTIEFLHNGSKVLFFGLDNVEKLKSIAGITSIWVEEASETLPDDVDQLNLRLRADTPHAQQITLSFNPISASHWLKKRFFDGETGEDVFIHHSTYRDNPHLPEDFSRAIEKLKNENPHYYRIYALGEWGVLKGVIYDKYETVDRMPESFEVEMLGLDFGYNHPQALVHIRIVENRAYIDELYYERERQNSAMIETMEKEAPWVKSVRCWADAARPDLIDECAKAGWRIDKAKKDVFSGINFVKKYRLIFTKRSTNLIRECQLYSWRVNKDGNTLDEPVKQNDDGMDAMRYGIFSELGGPGKKIIGSNIRGL